MYPALMPRTMLDCVNYRLSVFVVTGTVAPYRRTSPTGTSLYDPHHVQLHVCCSVPMALDGGMTSVWDATYPSHISEVIGILGMLHH